MDKFEGFHTFYCGGCELAFVAPESDMTIGDFISEANRTIKEEWNQEDDYRDSGYPFSTEHVNTTHVVYDPDLEWEGEKGLYTFGSKKAPDAIQCYLISLD